MKYDAKAKAMCHLDYAMSEAGGASNFVREYTIASGGPYCICGDKDPYLKEHPEYIDEQGYRRNR